MKKIALPCIVVALSLCFVACGQSSGKDNAPDGGNKSKTEEIQDIDYSDVLDDSYSKFSNMETALRDSSSDSYFNLSLSVIDFLLSEPDKINEKNIRVNDGYVISDYSRIKVGYYNDAERASKEFKYIIDDLVSKYDISLDYASSNEYSLSDDEDSGHFLYSKSFVPAELSEFNVRSFKFSQGLYLRGNYVIIISSYSFNDEPCGFINDFCRSAELSSPLDVVNSDAVKLSPFYDLLFHDYQVHSVDKEIARQLNGG